MRLPISAEAKSDCARRRIVSCGSGGGANVGELSVLDTSVGGVETREMSSLEVLAMLGGGGSRLAACLPGVDGAGAANLLASEWISKQKTYHPAWTDIGHRKDSQETVQLEYEAWESSKLSNLRRSAPTIFQPQRLVNLKGYSIHPASKHVFAEPTRHV